MNIDDRSVTQRVRLTITWPGKEPDVHEMRRGYAEIIAESERIKGAKTSIRAVRRRR